MNSDFTSPHLHSVLVVNGLKDWITDDHLHELFFKAKFILRETFEVAYVCYRNTNTAYKAFQRFDHYCIHAQEPEQSDCYLRLEEAKQYVVSRMNDILLAAPFESRPTCTIKVVCSTKLTINIWSQLFPKAFDVYRSVDAHKVFFQFTSTDLARQALRQIHHKILTLPLKTGVANVMFACTFVELDAVMAKIKHNSLAFESIRCQERLCNSVVEWLYI